MKNRLALLFLIFLATVATAGKPKRDVFVFIPDLTERKLGFALSPEEKAENKDFIARRIGRLAKGVPCIAKCNTASVDSAKAKRAIVAVFLIKEFFLSYYSIGYRQGTTNALLAVFDTANGYSRPCFTVSGCDTGTTWWGNYKPFTTSLRSVIYSFEDSFKKAKDRGQSISSGTIEELALSSPTADCDATVYLRTPQFTPETIGYAPTDEEMHDFSNEIAYYLESITGKRVLIFEKDAEDSISSCAKQFAEFEISRKNSTFSLLLFPKSTEAGITFKKSLVAGKDADWSDSELFCNLISDAFLRFSRDFLAKK